jgi:PhnB protein
MPSNPPENTPRITPYILYEDLEGALDWLARAFGFKERLRMPEQEGRIAHAEMQLADGVVMMGYPGPEYKSPKRHGHVCQLIYVYVDDVDGHFEDAKAAGAKILTELEDKYYGDRMYSAEDLEGHHWFFSQHVRDVDLADMKPPSS